jgi:hypothetical protein
MRRALILLLAAMAVAATAGCGSSDESENLSPEAKAVARTYTDFINAEKRGDGEAACALLTPEFQRRAGAAVAVGSRAALKGASCPKAIEQGTLPQIQQVIPNLQRIKVKGNRATGLDPGEGQFGPQRVFFERLGGDWKISRTVFFSIKQPG